jgi:hypothetical protein
VAGTVSSVSERHIVLQDEARTRRQMNMNPGASELQDFGGMSGCAAYEWVSEARRFRLVAFLYEDCRAERIENTGFWLVNARFVADTGLLDRGLMPW